VLLHSKIHEERLIALFLFVAQFEKGDFSQQQKIFTLYIDNTRWINNWDLVDLSAPKIVGAYLFDKDKKILFDFACSECIWERRIAIVSTYYFIKRDFLETTLDLATILLHDKEELIHKAVGWMLRELGKKNSILLETYLSAHYVDFPRMTLRYAIERFPAEKRKKMLKGNFELK
jgi:3-methyladenine DNA glycosylase AlkD